MKIGDKIKMKMADSHHLRTIFWIGFAILFALAVSLRKRTDLRKEQWISDERYKMKRYYSLTSHWLLKKIRNESMNTYFRDKPWNTVGIYGMGDMGRCLLEEIERNGIDVNVAFVVDKEADFIVANVPVYKPEEELPDADVIIVTPTWYYSSIRTMLDQKVKCPVISLEEVLEHGR